MTMRAIRTQTRGRSDGTERSGAAAATVGASERASANVREVSSRLRGSRDREFGACTHRLAYIYIYVYIYARLGCERRARGRDRRQVKRRSGWLATLADRLAEHDARLRRHVRCTIGEVQSGDGDERRRGRRGGIVGERERGRRHDGGGGDVEEVRGTAVYAVRSEQLFVLLQACVPYVRNGARGPRPVLGQSAYRYLAGDILVFVARDQNKSLSGI